MTSTIIQQGRFTSDGTSKLIDLRSGVDWMEVINETQFATTQTPGRGVKFEWQKGLSNGEAFEYTKADGADTLQAEKVTSGGFTLLSGAQSFGAPLAGTSITKAAPPVCTVNNHGYSDGDNVILSNLTNMPQIGSVVFTIGNVTTNTFELSFFDTTSGNFVIETAFTARRVPDSFFSWTNTLSVVTAVTLGSTTSIQTSSNIPNMTYSVNDVIRFTIPDEYGTSELNGRSGKILSYSAATNTYVVDIDSSSFTSFAWPAASAVPVSLPIFVKEGNVNTDASTATQNTESIQMNLGAGIDGPAGSSGDVIYWKAGKSFSVTNE